MPLESVVRSDAHAVNLISLIKHIVHDAEDSKRSQEHIAAIKDILKVDIPDLSTIPPIPIIERGEDTSELAEANPGGLVIMRYSVRGVTQYRLMFSAGGSWH